MTTKIASQRNQYVLLQISVDSKQEGITVKERQYFFVADRKLKKGLSITDVLNPTQKKYFNDLIVYESNVSTASERLFCSRSNP